MQVVAIPEKTRLHACMLLACQPSAPPGCHWFKPRTISSDAKWDYMNLRRYFVCLEYSIDKSTQVAVFEQNGDLLRANNRRLSDVLVKQWGARVRAG